MPRTVHLGSIAKPWLLVPAARDSARQIVGHSDLGSIDRLGAA